MSRSYLLDTQILLWGVGFEAHRLPLGVRGLLTDTDARFIVSMASMFEIAIKSAIGKLEVPKEIYTIPFESGYERLDIEPHHLAQLSTLPLVHRDPFDRLLVAQAVCEKLTFITTDDAIAKYGQHASIELVRAKGTS